MNILLAHNYYQQRGGEDGVFEAEARLLESRGHRVVRYSVRNDRLGEIDALRLAASTIWNWEIERELRSIVRRERIDIAHFHNTFPLISPSGYYGAQAGGAAVVQTFHNYRLLCVNAKLYRDSAICDACVGRAPWRGVLGKCYRGSVAASGVTAAMLIFHRVKGTWDARVHRYIALTEFAKRKLVKGGLSEALITVKPNFVDTGDTTTAAENPRTAFLYVGRVTEEKGLRSLIEATAVSGTSLRIAGDGPMPLRDLPGTTVHLGPQEPERVRAEMRSALCLVVPSIWYEGFPLVVLEAFASGLPVIASRIGGLEEIVEDGITGLLFRAGDAVDLARKLRWASVNREAMTEMGRNARRTFEAHYTKERNYERLMEIYRDALYARDSGGLP